MPTPLHEQETVPAVISTQLDVPGQVSQASQAILVESSAGIVDDVDLIHTQRTLRLGSTDSVSGSSTLATSSSFDDTALEGRVAQALCVPFLETSC